jgi:tRNA pseudouridine55 synthase
MIICINKPPGITSHDVVKKIRKITGEKRVGHGGTLDPFASGVLVVGISRESTKKLTDILKNSDKEYIATLELGKISTTGDPEGEIEQIAEKSRLLKITKKEIQNTLKKFIGEIKQKPPIYSAIKIGGIPAYSYARRGKKVTLPVRTVNIKKIKLGEFDPPFLKIQIIASSGTYIRTLAEDIGKKLGVGAYLTDLIRTRVGNFGINKSRTIEEFEEDAKALHN